jgi:hypothetical protein
LGDNFLQKIPSWFASGMQKFGESFEQDDEFKNTQRLMRSSDPLNLVQLAMESGEGTKF